MSGSPKTLTLTPEQQAKLDHLVEREMDEAYYTGTYMKAKDARACLREFAVEVLEEVGEPPTPRVDAAELRAAAEAWGDAHRHFRYVLAHPDQGSSEPYLWAEHEFYQAEERLLAALAATEGEES